MSEIFEKYLTEERIPSGDEGELTNDEQKALDGLLKKLGKSYRRSGSDYTIEYEKEFPNKRIKVEIEKDPRGKKTDWIISVDSTYFLSFTEGDGRNQVKEVGFFTQSMID